MGGIRLKAFECPNCGADLTDKNIKNNKAYCDYCGNVFFIEEIKTTVPNPKKYKKINKGDCLETLIRKT